jgi:DNA polymerase III psi subunit
MIEAQRRAYLEAMDISVWLQKPAAADRSRLIIGPGSSGTLLVCGQAEDSASLLAGDICRFLGDNPVWAWPDTEGSSESLALENAIDEFLFTRVLLFGQSLASGLFSGLIEKVLGSASIMLVPELDDLKVSAGARRDLWRQLS